MIRWKCTRCKEEITAENEDAGRRIRCLSCDARQEVPEPREKDEDRPSRRRVRDDDDADEPRRRRDEEDDDDDRMAGPRCPNCGSRRSTKVSFTWWGGVVGPALVSMVGCDRCGQRYNGKTGKSTDQFVVIYTVVGLILGLAVGAAFVWLR